MPAKLCREDLMFLANTCKQSGLYTRMSEYMTQIIKGGFELSSVERHLFSIAFKHNIGSLRSSWATLEEYRNSISQDNSSRSFVESTLLGIEDRIREVAGCVLTLLEQNIFPLCSGDEAKVYYLKLQGDYQRYIAEISGGSLHEVWASKAYNSYKTSADIALTKLPPTHCTRLGLMMNFSVFYYDVYGSPERACLLTKTAYDDAIVGGIADTKSDREENHDSLEILRLMKSNLKIWTNVLSLT